MPPRKQAAAPAKQKSPSQAVPVEKPGWYRSTPPKPGATPPTTAEAEVSSVNAGKKRKADGVIEGGSNQAKKGKVDKGKKKAIPEEKFNGKKVLRAIRPIWTDLPRWGERKDCPLLDIIHPELLDKCFNPGQDFAMRDWIALAGVNRFFRTCLDDEVFNEVFCIGAGVRFSPWASESQSETSLHPAYHPFTRDIEPTTTSPTNASTTTLPDLAVPSYYVPSGPREQWTRQEYFRYKEEKRDRAERDRYEMADGIAQYEAQRAEAMGQKWPPVQKIKYYSDTFHGTEMVVMKMIPGLRHGSLVEAEKIEVAPGQEEPKKVVERWEILPDGEEWEVPDTDGEDEVYASVVPANSKHGEREVVTPWPSRWRSMAAEEVLLKDHKIKPEELLTLKHAIVRPSSRRKNLANAYRLSAVQALALRSHGGPDGYLRILQDKQTGAINRAANKQTKIDEAIATGKPLPGPKPRAKKASTGRYAQWDQKDMEMEMADPLMMMFGRGMPGWEPYDPECGGMPWGG